MKELYFGIILLIGIFITILGIGFSNTLIMIGLFICMFSFFFLPNYKFKLTYTYELHGIRICVRIKLDVEEVIFITKRENVSYDTIREIVIKTYDDLTYDEWSGERKELEDLIEFANMLYKRIEQFFLDVKVTATVDRIVVSKENQVVMRD